MSDNPTAGGSVIAAARAGASWKVIALIAALIIAAVTGYSWLKAHDAWLRFQIESQSKDQQIALRDKQAAADREVIEQLKKQAQTPQQIVREIPQVISLPLPPEELGARSPAPGKGADSRLPTPHPLPDAPQSQQAGIVFPSRCQAPVRPPGRLQGDGEPALGLPTELPGYEEGAGSGSQG